MEVSNGYAALEKLGEGLEIKSSWKRIREKPKITEDIIC
jgi:hypothetical protein